MNRHEIMRAAACVLGLLLTGHPLSSALDLGGLDISPTEEDAIWDQTGLWFHRVRVGTLSGNYDSPEVMGELQAFLRGEEGMELGEELASQVVYCWDEEEEAYD